MEHGQAYGRVNAAATWEVLHEDVSGMFAPGGDPMGYLVAAENVQKSDELGVMSDELAVHSKLITHHSSFVFDLSGPKYASFMREQMQAELSRKGQLPAGMSLGLAQQFINMTGHGEFWLNEAGLPVRQVIHIKFPAETGAVNWVSADITTKFRDWHVNGAKQSSWFMPQWATAKAVALLPTPYSLFPVLGLSMLMMGVMALSVIHRNSQKLYAAMSLSVIFSMLVTPLMQINQVQAFNQAQRERQASLMNNEQVGMSNEGSYNPNVNPVEQNLPTKDNLLINNCSLLITNSQTACDPNTDSDGDGLKDSVECHALGTWRDKMDGDFISDKAEVTGYTDSSGKKWYLDPRNPDSRGMS